jgi:hypothetical protein
MQDLANILFGDPAIGLSDKAFHLERDVEPGRVIPLLREYADDAGGYHDFLGRIFAASDGDDPGIYLGKVAAAKYDYIVDYDENLIRVVLYRITPHDNAEELVRRSNEEYGSVGSVLYDKDQKIIMLITDLMPGGKSPRAKRLDGTPGYSNTAKL